MFPSVNLSVNIYNFSWLSVMWTVRNQDPKTEFKNNTELIKTPKLSLTIKETKIKAQHGNAAAEEEVETAEANQHK